MSAKAHIGISPLVGVKRAESILARFKAKHPHARLCYHECSLDELHAEFVRGRLDVIIVPNDPQIPVRPEYMRLPLMLDRLLFVPRRSQHERWRPVECVAVKDIADERFVLLPDTCGLTRATYRLFQAHGCSINRHVGEASSYRAILEWTEVSLASEILPNSKILEHREIVIPILDGGHPVAIEYIVLGKPPKVATKIFTELWDSLLESEVALASGMLAEEKPAQSSCWHLSRA
ncbi:MAG: LysR family transcriptional regulator substrate-binding protein [Proteobacteria bacterium]|nr:LysR family transcriptional regulator substrate-binding protein [Pseudomonadota bacterium]